jgi:phospholipase/carboxylesterase
MRCLEISMAGELDGPRLEPRAGQARQLVVFLHGYGADGNDLIEIGRAWQPAMPQAAFVSPHAPQACGQAPMGREWFPLTFRDPNERWTGVNAAAPCLDAFLDAELQRRNLPASALALVGFSQGTMMALHVGLRRGTAPAAIVGYSGMLVLPPDADPDKLPLEIRSKPPVLLLHGEQDGLCPPEGSRMVYEGAQTIDRTLNVYPGLYHEVFNEPERDRVLDDLSAWLLQRCEQP